MRELRLLCATDMSEQSERAVQRALLLSEQLDAELLLFHSINAARTDRLTRRKQVRAQLALTSRSGAFAGATREPRIVVRVGDHQGTIADIAREWDADLIILGARTERFGESVVGTTAERVSRKARRPILVVNRDVAGPYEHVLLTSDLTRESAGAARMAEHLGLLESGLTAVVHSLSPAGVSMLRVSGVSEPAIETYVRGMSHSTSQEIMQQLEHAGVHTERLSVLARPAAPLRAIEHAAQLTDADLVVVGSSHFPVLKRIVLGSVSNEVLRRMTCDVLLVSPGAIKHASTRLH